MKIGDLVKITQSRIGVPSGSVALIIDEYTINYDEPGEDSVFMLQLISPKKEMWQIRRLARDLELVSD
tara:strand:+ start:320 stop:523 length:204 start_codon:yes stop_codon:yes gene_type:complete